MGAVDKLRKKLKEGEVYRRSDLATWSSSVDRDLNDLVTEGALQKLSQGLFYYPRQTVFGKTPPDEKVLVRSFLKDDNFLLTSPNVFNSLGVGTTQLYNTKVVYNHKRHGKFKFGNQEFDFRVKHHFPKKPTTEFLLVDLVNNLDTLAEDKASVLKNVADKVTSMDKKALKRSVAQYGSVKTKKIFAPLI
ncbi:hypothetical protein [Dinghuibacter silviterrae]|uniref:Uncharacterized protein n=1 Tax=Dinghuibacter silviterrae TaxID=1539049 RepID=A0A4R8DQ71_9BACT|nr:hypothetical protein [Dinghuibacter silviterrae]TDX00274.1 hypothetical protein EDB95_1293 [Dinghuibacter silviterrae]